VTSLPVADQSVISVVGLLLVLMFPSCAKADAASPEGVAFSTGRATHDRSLPARGKVHIILVFSPIMHPTVFPSDLGQLSSSACAGRTPRWLCQAV
jgi:hypothetical protein